MIAYSIMKAFTAFLLGKRGRQSNQNRRQQAYREQQPENKQDKIIEYHKKKFESSEIEDADFVEYKETNSK